MLNPIIITDKPNQPIGTPHDEPGRLYTHDMLDKARREITLLRQMYRFYDAETHAMHTTCSDGTTIKAHIDHLVFDLHLTNWVKRGPWLWVSNANNKLHPDQFRIRVDLQPYLLAALYYLNNFDNQP